MQLGPRITAAREELGYTQAQLAERVPCNPQTISNWETGRRQPRYQELLRLAEVLRRPVSWFLGEEAGGDAGWEHVQAALDRPAGRGGGDLLVPVVGYLGDGSEPVLVREPCGWRLFAAAQVEGVTLWQVRGDAHHPLLQDGDLVAVEAADTAAPGQLVTARLTDGTELLQRLGAGGALESANPGYPARREPGAAITGVVRWQHRDHRPAPDLVGDAAERLAWVQEAESELGALEGRIERGEGQWSELRALCDRVVAAAEALRPVYGSAVLEPAARALARSARGLGEQGDYPEAVRLARQAEAFYQAVEEVGGRSRDALNNLYNLSQLALFLGDLAEAEDAARRAAECDDWTVRWKALKNLAELRANYRGEDPPDDLCDDILALADAHADEDPVQAHLARSVAQEIRGNAAFTRGDLPAAEAAARQELAAAEAAGGPYRLANALLNLAHYAVMRGDADTATNALTRAAPLTFGQALGDLDAMRLAHLAAALALRGEVDRARATLHGAMRQAARLESPRAALMAELAGLVLAKVSGDLLAREDHAAASTGWSPGARDDAVPSGLGGSALAAAARRLRRRVQGHLHHHRQRAGRRDLRQGRRSERAAGGQRHGAAPRQRQQPHRPARAHGRRRPLRDRPGRPGAARRGRAALHPGRPAQHACHGGDPPRRQPRSAGHADRHGRRDGGAGAAGAGQRRDRAGRRRPGRPGAARRRRAQRTVPARSARRVRSGAQRCEADLPADRPQRQLAAQPRRAAAGEHRGDRPDARRPRRRPPWRDP
ncbi:MAG: LexA family transcriptional regulator [Armatimonadetes bacterium]|nr:LexA family transcriptional regulator [Armatimonadota bacterium]